MVKSLLVLMMVLVGGLNLGIMLSVLFARERAKKVHGPKRLLRVIVLNLISLIMAVYMAYALLVRP